MAIVQEALVCERYWCMGQAGLVLLLFVCCCYLLFVVFLFLCFFISIISSLFLHTLLYLFMIAFQILNCKLSLDLQNVRPSVRPSVLPYHYISCSFYRILSISHTGHHYNVAGVMEETFLGSFSGRFSGR